MRQLLLLLSTFLCCTTWLTSAQSAPNEFIIKADNYDTLSAHAHNCTFLIDSGFAVTVCGDGYFAIDDTADLINTNTAFKVSANLTIALTSGPKDLRLDSYLSVVDEPGQKLTVIKKNVVEALHIELDREEAPGGVILAKRAMVGKINIAMMRQPNTTSVKIMNTRSLIPR